MQSKPFFVIVASLILGFAGFLGTSLYFNARLQALLDVQINAHKLVVTWNKAESLNQELLITYELEDRKQAWLGSTQKFDKDFKTFLFALSRQRSLNDDLDLKIKVAKINMHWSVVQKRLYDAHNLLERHLSSPNADKGSGNLLVDFGQNLAQGNFNQNTINLLEKLRWTTSLSRYAFKNALIDVTQYASKSVQAQVARLKIISMGLSAFTLAVAGIFILFRIAEMARSREAASRHATELSAKVKERDHAKRLLLSEKDKLHAVINAMGDGIYVVTPDFTIEFQSQVLEKKFPGAHGKKCYKAYMNIDHPCDFCLSKKTIETGTLEQVETMRGNGHHHELIFSPFVDIDMQTKNMVLIRDITARKRFETEAARSGYLASIGELAAGVAHEINNPINGIISLAEVLQDNPGDGATTREATIRIIREGERIAKIVKNLLSFARDRKEDAGLVDIRDILADAMDLIGKQIQKDGTQLTIDLPDELPKVKVVKQEIQQVFLNLLSNGRYALNCKYPEPDINKFFTIYGCHLRVDGRSIVRIIFRDSGVGIPEASLAKVGLPFYSTKPPRKGTGLGLSISRNIIENYGGRLYIESEYGNFTAITIELPGVPES